MYTIYWHFVYFVNLDTIMYLNTVICRNRYPTVPQIIVKKERNILKGTSEIKQLVRVLIKLIRIWI